MVVASAGLLAFHFHSRLYLKTSVDVYWWSLGVFIGIWVACLYYSGMYTSYRMKRVSDVLFLTYQSAYLSFLFFACFVYLFHIQTLSRTLVIDAFLLAMGLVAIEKIVLVVILRRLRERGFNYRNVLLVGTGTRARQFVKELDFSKESGLKIMGILDRDPALVGTRIHGYPVVGLISDLPKITKEQVIDQVFFVVPRNWLDEIEPTILYLEKLGIRSDVAVDHFNMTFARAKQTEIFDVPFLSFETAPSHLLSLLVKRGIDIMLSGIALMLLSPIFLITGFLVLWTSPGPVLFEQERVGMNGRLFKILKFRTMVVDAEAKQAELMKFNQMKGAAFKMDNDPRVTIIGKILRKTSIDELPQLWNVFRGDMSLVGPRPPIPKEVATYDDWHRRRLSMRPGITCIWQISGRNKIRDVDQWFALDLKYIDNWSLWLDFKILFKTVPVVLFGIGAK